MMTAHGWEKDQRRTLARAATMTEVLDLVSTA
jgi:hypothetical protein